ncbi:MAG TPA: glycosyltransferase family 2 protein [Bacteroidales bacterium]|nr:glycosyltransferase family 2 protein [Bacteroidales bacterium]
MFSLVIPIFNEATLIDELVRRTVQAAEHITSDYEIIFVNDGSSDASLGKLLLYRNENRRIKVLSLSRNFGHQAAFTAGLEYSKGDIVAMMDGDLQDPPELLAKMYSGITKDGYDVISGRKTGRKGNVRRNFYTLIFHKIFSHVTDINNVGNAGNFSMMTRNALDALLSMNEKTRYLPGMRAFIGFRQGFVDFVRDERYDGNPKMSYGKLVTLAFDAIFSFSRFPITFCLYLGITGIIVFMAAGIYVLIAKLMHFAVPGWSSTLLSIYFLGSIQLVFLGIIGEYIFRNYKESQNRPVYFVKKFYD